MNDRRHHRTMKINPLESLDERIVPSGLAASEAVVAAKGGPALGAIYQEYVKYENSGHHGAFASAESGQVALLGTTVGVNIHLNGNFNNLLKQLHKDGMTVTSTNTQAGDVQGFLPIGKLPPVVTSGHTASIAPIFLGVSTPAPAPAPVVATVFVPTVSALSASVPSAVTPTAAAVTVSPLSSPSGGSDSVVTAKGGHILGSIYQEYLNYLSAGSTGTFSPVESREVQFRGTSVGVDVHVNGNVAAIAAELASNGMQVTATAPQAAIVEGYLPIAELPTVASDASVTSLSPIYKAVGLGSGGRAL